MHMSDSRARAWLRCPRLHHYQYDLRRVPVQVAQPLRFGRAWDEMMGAWWSSVCEAQNEPEFDPGEAISCMTDIAYAADVDEYDREVLIVLACAYHSRNWQSAVAGPMVIDTQVEICAEDCDGNTRVGYMDLLTDAGPADHKTSGLNIEPGRDYHEGLRRNTQASEYLLHSGCESITWDVVGKPTIKPSKATPLDKIRYKKNGEPYANVRLDDERPDEYAKRVAEDIEKRPEKYFQRYTVVRSQEELEAHDEDMRSVAAGIKLYQIAKIRPPRNPSNCTSLGRCGYYDACWNGADIYGPEFTDRKRKS